MPSQPIIAYSDAPFMTPRKEMMRAISGSAIYVYNCLVQWSSKTQSITAGSTMEAELIAASSASDKALWFFHLLESLPFLFGNIDPSPIPLFVDNLAALSVSQVHTLTL